MAPKPDCYSGGFAFDEDEEDKQPRAASQPSSRPPPPPLAPPPLEPSAPEAADAGPSGSSPLLYIKSDRLTELSTHLPVNADRSALVNGLVQAYGLLEGAAVEQAAPASLEQLEEYHTRQYLAALARPGQLSERQRAECGLEDDCSPFPGLYEHSALTAGGALQAAAALASGAARTAVWLEGGRHHAHKSRAAGFCYVNDVVLAILRLLSSFKRVLYLDVDLHHCDAVEEAFELTPRVLTISLHKQEPGFFPGTGPMGAGGRGAGRGFSLNLPLKDGLRDGLFGRALAELAGGAAAAFDPDCVVMQCGVDGLAHDPLAGSWALTPAAYAAAASLAASWGRPLLLLGGGGYCSRAAAATWAGVVAELAGKAPLADDIPEHEFFDRYGPAFTLSSATKRLLPPDTNKEEAVLASCRQLLSELRSAVQRMRGGSAAGGGCSNAASGGGAGQAGEEGCQHASKRARAAA